LDPDHARTPLCRTLQPQTPIDHRIHFNCDFPERFPPLNDSLLIPSPPQIRARISPRFSETDPGITRKTPRFFLFKKVPENSPDCQNKSLKLLNPTPQRGPHFIRHLIQPIEDEIVPWNTKRCPRLKMGYLDVFWQNIWKSGVF
jgi:hypothetical protein